MADQPASAAQPTRAVGVGRLREGSIGFHQLLFQSITFMGPAAGVALSMLVVVALAGRLVPLAFALAALACLLVAACVGQLAKEMPSAGGLYTYVARALGPQAGFMVGWLALLFLLLAPALIFLALAFVTNDVLMSDARGLALTGVPWWPWVIGCAAIVLALNVRGVRLSANIGVVLGVIEIALFLALAAWVVATRADQNTLQVFDFRDPEIGGLEGVFKATAIAFVSFVGFEASAYLAEEARRPRWAVPRAVMLATLLIGAFFVFCAYATVIGFGVPDFTRLALEAGNPWLELGDRFWGAGWLVLLFALVSSMLGVGNAAANAASRLIYAMGRNGALPSAFGRIHPSYGTPWLAVVAVVALASAVALAAGMYWDLLPALTVVATGVAISALLIYLAVCIATVAFYVRQRRALFRLWLHGLVPVAAALLLLAPLYFQYQPLPAYPTVLANWFVIAWVLVGGVIAAWFSVRRPDALFNAQRVFAGADELLPNTTR